MIKPFLSSPKSCERNIQNFIVPRYVIFVTLKSLFHLCTRKNDQGSSNVSDTHSRFYCCCLFLFYSRTNTPCYHKFRHCFYRPFLFGSKTYSQWTLYFWQRTRLQQTKVSYDTISSLI